MLEPNTLVYAYQKAQSGELDVFAFDARAVFENPEMEAEKSRYKTYYPRPDTYTDITSGEVFFTRQIRDGKFIMQPCCQLIKRKFLLDSGVRFIPGILQEDNAFTVELLFHARRVSHENRPFYIRRVRPGSIMTKKTSFENAYGYFRCEEVLVPYWKRSSLNQETAPALVDFIQGLIQNMKRIYESLPNVEKVKVMNLPGEEKEAMLFLLEKLESICKNNVSNNI